MDSNHNAITSVEQFRDELQWTLERARANLARDKHLANVALLYGHPESRQLLLINVPHEVVSARLKKEVRHRQFESVFFIGLAAVGGNRADGGEPIYRARAEYVAEPPPGSALCVMVEASHRDFGSYAAHVEFRPNGESFTFGKSDSGRLVGGMLADLWPAKKLNG